jgi:hypothetical protein
LYLKTKNVHLPRERVCYVKTAKTLKFVKLFCTSKVKANNKLYFLKGKKIMNRDFVNLGFGIALGVSGTIAIQQHFPPQTQAVIPKNCKTEVAVSFTTYGPGDTVEKSQVYFPGNTLQALNFATNLQEEALRDGKRAVPFFSETTVRDGDCKSPFIKE